MHTPLPELQRAHGPRCGEGSPLTPNNRPRHRAPPPPRPAWCLPTPYHARCAPPSTSACCTLPQPLTTHRQKHSATPCARATRNGGGGGLAPRRSRRGGTAVVHDRISTLCSGAFRRIRQRQSKDPMCPSFRRRSSRTYTRRRLVHLSGRVCFAELLVVLNPADSALAVGFSCRCGGDAVQGRHACLPPASGP